MRLVASVIVFFLLLGLAVISVAGYRGSKSRRPPLEVFPDMDRQPKLRPQTANAFFSDRLSSQLPVAGTVARAEPFTLADGKKVFPYEDHPVNNGHIPGTTNFVEQGPLAVSETFLQRGQQRYMINCAPCHGATGEGKGITTKLGMAGVANFHDLRLVKMPDGEIFNTITHGKNTMGPYAANVTVADRWAIVAYVRALQHTRLGVIDEVPASERSRIPNAPPATAK